MELQEIVGRKRSEHDCVLEREFKYRFREGVEKGVLKSSIFYVDAKESLDMMEGMIEILVEYEFRQSSFEIGEQKRKT
jgi:hypothetical protein